MTMKGARLEVSDPTSKTRVVPLDPVRAKKRLLEIFSVQRSDGWFLRQYSTAGREGNHDLRNYMDAGFWVWEFLLEYLVYTRDLGLLKKKVGWLDQSRRDSIFH